MHCVNSFGKIRITPRWKLNAFTTTKLCAHHEPLSGVGTAYHVLVNRSKYHNQLKFSILNLIIGTLCTNNETTACWLAHAHTHMPSAGKSHFPWLCDDKRATVNTNWVVVLCGFNEWRPRHACACANNIQYPSTKRCIDVNGLGMDRWEKKTTTKETFSVASNCWKGEFSRKRIYQFACTLVSRLFARNNIEFGYEVAGSVAVSRCTAICRIRHSQWCIFNGITFTQNTETMTENETDNDSGATLVTLITNNFINSFSRAARGISIEYEFQNGAITWLQPFCEWVCVCGIISHCIRTWIVFKFYQFIALQRIQWMRAGVCWCFSPSSKILAHPHPHRLTKNCIQHLPLNRRKKMVS